MATAQEQLGDIFGSSLRSFLPQQQQNTDPFAAPTGIAPNLSAPLTQAQQQTFTPQNVSGALTVAGGMPAGDYAKQFGMDYSAPPILGDMTPEARAAWLKANDPGAFNPQDPTGSGRVTNPTGTGAQQMPGSIRQMAQGMGLTQMSSAPVLNPNDQFYRGEQDWYGAGYQPDATSSAFTANPGTIPQDNQPGNNGGFRIRMRGPNGQWVFSRDHSWIAHALQNGWEAVGDDGGKLNATSFGGGWLIDGVPINAALTGEMTQEQADALRAGGLWGPNAAGARITANGGMPAGHDAGGGRTTSGGTTSGGGTTGGNTGGIPGIDSTVPDNARDVYKQLLEAILKRTSGADALSKAGIDFFDRANARGDQTAAKRDQYINGLYPGMKDTLDYFMANKDKAEGLSPEGRSALRLQLNEGIPERFNQAAQSMNTELLRRGADTGQMPGSQGDIVRGFAPLYAARAGEYSKANRDVILQDEQQKLQSLLANRQLASQAVGQGTGLTGTLGQIYNPNADYNTGLGGLNAGIGGFGAGTQGLGVASGLAGGLADLEPTSFRNLLLASLLSAGSNGLGDILSGAAGGAGGVGGIISALGRIFGGIFGGGTRPGPDDSNPEDI